MRNGHRTAVPSRPARCLGAAAGPRRRAVCWAAALLALSSVPRVLAGDEPYPPSRDAIALDRAVAWDNIRLLAVQDGLRYKTLESFARESMSALVGREHFPGLSPVASLMEWVFHRDAYADVPLIRIRDVGIRYHVTAGIANGDARQRIISTGMMTPREFDDPRVRDRISEIASRNTMASAMNRVGAAAAVARRIDDLMAIVPQPGGDAQAPWHAPKELLANIPKELLRAGGLNPNSVLTQGSGPVAGLSSDQALEIVLAWASLRDAWLRRDPGEVTAQFTRLAGQVEPLAAPGVYPTRMQRVAEAHYYSMGKMTWGWMLYLLGAVVSVWAIVTPWKTPWWSSLALLAAALALHCYGLALRWFILGRIPNANMFEAIMFSAALGILCVLVFEMVYRSRVFLLAAHAAGFFALVVAGFVVPRGQALESIPDILDNVMLRIHTVLIILSYALIFIASVIALVYLFAYYFHTARIRSMETGLLGLLFGLWLLLFSTIAFRGVDPVTHEPGVVKQAWVAPVFWCAAGVLAGLAALSPRLGMRNVGLAAALLGAAASVTLGIGSKGFVLGTGATLAGVGALWALLNWVGGLLGQRRTAAVPAISLAAPGVGAIALGGPRSASIGRPESRPILAGGMPGDEKSLPGWINNIDWNHLIILNIVFVTLFVGTILGAVWADYSWGRPWGWDPKEVFALNTWIIYAILIHARFVTGKRGLWTAWLSVAGCLMMVFNWCFVNFFLVGLHSYA